MDILIKLEIEDWNQYQSYIEKELSKSVKSWTDSFRFNLVLWGVTGFILMSIFRNLSEIHWPTVGVVSVFYILIFILFIIKLAKLKKAFAPSETGVFFGEHQFVFDEEGIKSKGHGYEGKHSWSVVQRIERTNGMILIFLDTAYAYIFPVSKLDNPDKLYNYINEQYKKI